ncbi:MAG: GNAT family N-acetyltransferase [Lachnospiraceae bacterium]|nr:GNAT family N-acetyltransferase [Lachnospiraceae bacterium]
MNLTIRKMNYADFDDLYELLSDPIIMEHIEPPFTKERAAQFLETAGLSNPSLIYSVEDENGNFIGYVIYHDYDAESKEIGWILKRNVWGKGYAKKLTEQLITRADSEGKSVIIECAPEQRVTKHIAEAFGFTYVGRHDGCDVYRRGRV